MTNTMSYTVWEDGCEDYPVATYNTLEEAVANCFENEYVEDGYGVIVYEG